MEVIVSKLHSCVDKFATLNQAGDVITFTTRDNKNKQTIDLAEGKRIFEDLQGDVSLRYSKSAEYLAIESRKGKALSRKAFKL